MYNKFKLFNTVGAGVGDSVGDEVGESCKICVNNIHYT